MTAKCCGIFRLWEYQSFNQTITNDQIALESRKLLSTDMAENYGVCSESEPDKWSTNYLHAHKVLPAFERSDKVSFVA